MSDAASDVGPEAARRWFCAPFAYFRKSKTEKGMHGIFIPILEAVLTTEIVSEKLSGKVVSCQPPSQARPTARPASNFSAELKPRRPSIQTVPSARMSLSSKRRKSSRASTRPSISGPTNFCHISSGAHGAAMQQPIVPVNNGFMALQLQLHTSGQHMSPILPNFDLNANVPSPPPGYVTSELSQDDRAYPRGRSFSAFSFHIPRKLTTDEASSTDGHSTPPTHRPQEAGPRARARTLSEIEIRKERIASRLIEAEKLQKQIDDVVERQSLYSCSRPGSAYSLAKTFQDMEPMPSIPALPPAAPSFAERLERPKTAPMHSHLDAWKTGAVPAAILIDPASPLQPKSPESDILAPPLPLILRPPLRKKKSFSRVSSWLGSNGHKRQFSVNSITNEPIPLKGSAGFYQCAPVFDTNFRNSFESYASGSTSSSFSVDTTPVSRPGDGLKTEAFNDMDKENIVPKTLLPTIIA